MSLSSPNPIRHLGIALVLLVAFACQQTWALASVTGSLIGTVVDAQTSAPIAGVQVTATSPSQTATTTTDAAGHFGFLTLGPDTYTVSASKAGYPSASVAGQVVFVDTVQTVSLKMIKARTIARVTSTAPGYYGHGVITPVQSWHKDGRDCYQGRYRFTFADGATESGDIVWPFCYDPSVNPFTHPTQIMPFPPPLVGFKLPAHAQMPPIEKRVYEKWAAANAPASYPP